MAARTETNIRREIESRMKYLEEDESEARAAVLKEEKAKQCEVWGDQLVDYWPEEQQIPDTGAWIQIKLPPVCEISAEFLSVWYALPVDKEKNWEFRSTDVKDRKARYKVKVLTPVGEFHLYPSEYTVISTATLSEYINMTGPSNDPNEEHVVINWLDPRNEQFDADKLLYIMSRGIRKSDAYRMLLGDIQSQHVCYLTFHVEYQRIFAGVGIPSLRARHMVEASIDHVLMEKAAGRWYDTGLAAQRAAATAEYEAKAEAERKEQARIEKARKAQEKKFAAMLPTALRSGLKRSRPHA